jgi:hypothetical protein
MDHLRAKYLIKRVDVLKLTIRVVGTVTVVLFCDLCKVFQLCAVLLHMLFTSVRKETDREWSFGLTEHLLVSLHEPFHGFSPIAPKEFQWSTEHLVESQSKHTVSLPTADCF